MAGNSATKQAIREVTFDVADEWQVPELSDLVPDGGALRIETRRLEQSRFDTVHQDLRGHGLTLAKSTGGTGPGWRLTGHSIAIERPLAGGTVPAELRQLLLGVRGGAALKATARMRTDRVTYRVVGADEAVLAELTIDDVTVTEVGEFAVIRQARQVTVGGPDKQRRRNLRTRLEESGAERGAPLAMSVEHAPPVEGYAAKSLLGVVQPYLAAQYDAIISGDLGLRDALDVVHETRVATRRYRTVLHQFADLFETDRALALEENLHWYAGLLGTVRDLEVLRARLTDLVLALPAELVAVAGPIDQSVASELERAQTELDRAMRSRRYFALIAELRAWSENLPTAGRQRSARSVERYLAKADKTVSNRAKRFAQLDESDPTHDEAMHRVRSAAKRARYTAELGEPVLGKAARKAIKHWTKVQDRLGKRQDAVVAAAFLRRVGSQAAGEYGFAVGVLWGGEVRRSRG